VIGVLYGLTAGDLQGQAGTPLLVKKRNLVDINNLDRYFKELKGRIRTKQ
jgi:hypothetical protein